jgi:hypothetical protein
MFDSSYARSRVYFKTLEILRIFADMIRETGRNLQEMDPAPLLQSSVSAARPPSNVRLFFREDPAKDQALKENWRLLSEFQREAEGRLLQKIAEKTEEIKSLRDGVGCRTCLNLSMRLIIFFPAFQRNLATRGLEIDHYQPLYHRLHHHDCSLPPAQFHRGTSSVYPFPEIQDADIVFRRQSLFSTPLFEEQTDIAAKFTTSTVITCFITYVLAVLLVWAADKWDAAGSLYRQMRSLASSTWTQVRRRGAMVVGSRRSNKVPGDSIGMIPAGP